ncbi:hypothetical protein ACWEIK_20030 [Streptomyces sp. NPDC004673]
MSARTDHSIEAVLNGSGITLLTFLAIATQAARISFRTSTATPASDIHFNFASAAHQSRREYLDDGAEAASLVARDGAHAPTVGRHPFPSYSGAMEQWAGVLVKVLLFAFVAGMFALVFTVSARGRKKVARIRDDYAQLPRIALQRGWTYEPRVRGHIDQYCGAGPLPGRGQNLSAWHYTTGEFRGRAFKYFEYRYINPMSGANASDRKQPIIESVFIVAAPGSGPSVEILPPSKLDAMLDRRDRTEVGVPEFDQRFRVVTDDADFVRGVLGSSVVPLLLTHPVAEKSPLQMRGSDLFTWYTGTLSPQAAEDRLNYLCDVLDRIPAQTWTVA